MNINLFFFGNRSQTFSCMDKKAEYFGIAWIIDCTQNPIISPLIMPLSQYFTSCSVFVTKNLSLLMLWYAFCYSINIIHILKVLLYLLILNYVLSFNIVILNGIPLDDIGKFENLLKTSLKMKKKSSSNRKLTSDWY